MSNTRSWTLTDVQNRIYVEQWRLSSVDLGLNLPRPWTISKRRLYGGLSDGVDIIEVDNGRFHFNILPTRGMGIWRGQLGDTVLGWKSPVQGPVHPSFVNQAALGGIGWLEGFDEWIVRCGLSSNGAPGEDVVTDSDGNEQRSTVTLHGRIANLPAHTVRVEVQLEAPYRISIHGVVDESMLFFPQLRLTTAICTEPGSAKFTITDTVSNLKGQPTDFQMLYHCNFGPSLLEEGSHIYAPVESVAPRDDFSASSVDSYNAYPEPTQGVAESAYWLALKGDANNETLTLLENAKADRACALRFNKTELPCFTLWKNPAAMKDGYVTGLEPGTNLPNVKGFERSQGRVVPLDIDESKTMHLTFQVAQGSDEVAALRQEVDQIQGNTPPKLHKAPVSGLSPS